jgi:hypothetical protein
LRSAVASEAVSRRSLPGQPLLLEVAHPVVQPVEAVTDDGLVLAAGGDRGERPVVAATPAQADQDAHDQPEREQQQRRCDVHARTLPPAADNLGKPRPAGPWSGGDRVAPALSPT